MSASTDLMLVVPKPVGGWSIENLRAGLHSVACDPPTWAGLIPTLHSAGVRLVVLSPHPVSRERELLPRLEQKWFRSRPSKGSVPADAGRLEEMLVRLVRKGGCTLVEGVEVLLFWNGLRRTMGLLESLDRRLLDKRATGLLHARAQVLDEDEFVTITSAYPVLLDLTTHQSAGQGSKEGATPLLRP